MRTVVAITGASGSALAVEFLKRCSGEKYLIVSRWGKSVLFQETGLTIESLAPYVTRIYSNEDMNAPFASGSNQFDQYVILPCSVTTMARIANGLGENLIARVGEVALKEKRTMLLGLRETPLSPIALSNASKLAQLGVIVMPLSPAFYMKPATPDEAVSNFIDHIFATLKLDEAAERKGPVSGWRSDELNRGGE